MSMECGLGKPVAIVRQPEFPRDAPRRPRSLPWVRASGLSLGGKLTRRSLDKLFQ